MPPERGSAGDAQFAGSLPAELPLLPLSGVVLFPFVVIPLAVSDPPLVAQIDWALTHDRLIVLVAHREGRVAEGETPWFRMGTVGTIVKMLKLPDGSVRILVQGVARARLRAVRGWGESPWGEIETVTAPEPRDVRTEARRRAVLALFQQIVGLSSHLSPDLPEVAQQIADGGKLADFVAAHLNLSVPEKQELLETLDPRRRLGRLSEHLVREVKVLELGSALQEKVKGEIARDQKEYFLREQMRVIRQELGEEDEDAREIQLLREELSRADLPEGPRQVAEKEIDRLAKMPSASQEYHVSRTYLDWILGLPWRRMSVDCLDLGRAREILERDHYDLERVKERILEHLAVRTLKPDARGPILCFVGPPGVGKTSLGRSIAEALGRQFVRISLGGIRDEAEIRGHRRTYVGSLPGRILQSLRRAGTANPVFVLDELDKLGTDFRGDPAAALLEVLDPAQNHAFSDHYLEIPFDLSRVLFITTANLLHTVPPALQDRLEVLELPGYTQEEKREIARRFLLPRQLAEQGMRRGQVSFTTAALDRLIAGYTREAGVRELEREIGSVVRKVAVRIVEGKRSPVRVGGAGLAGFLGPPRFLPEIAGRSDEVGVATALAWTSAGGRIMFIEATQMPGSGKSLQLTGHLGDIMKESAQTALSYLRSRAPALGLSGRVFERSDLHLHIPAGATPKDGPSAGIAIATALASLLTGRPVRHGVAMTGEMTLRGRVLPVGGVKEKVLAARRAGIHTVILPEQNRGDVEEIPREARRGLTVVFADRVEGVLEAALGGARGRSRAPRPRERDRRTERNRGRSLRADRRRAR